MEGKSYVNPPPRFTDSCRRMVEAAGPPRRVYQVWKGNNKFFFGGRFVFGPDVRSLILTVFLIVVPVILFTVFVSQKLINEFEHNIGDLIVSLAVIFTIYILFLLFLTSGIDPGIVPRNLHPPEPEEDDCSNSTNAGKQNRQPVLATTKDVIVNGAIVRVKYCNTCMLYRPPRCSHCSVCNNCVERFDHHCPWVGQCIGKRNYRFFFMFVSATTLLCLYVFAFCWVNLKKIMISNQCNLWRAIVESPVSGILILYTFVAVWFVGGLTAFHSYLIFTNQTTYENFRYRYDREMNPYNLGCLENFKEIFLSSLPESRNDFRAKVKEDKPVFSASLSMDPTLSPDLAKTSIDLEAGGKRQTVAAEELEDIQNQMENVRGSQRCGTHPMGNSSRGGLRDSSEITPDLQVLAAELGMQHGPTDEQY